MRALCFGSLNIDYVYQVPHFAARRERLWPHLSSAATAAGRA